MSDSFDNLKIWGLQMFTIQDITIHPSAEVSDEARIGKGTRVWHQAQIREGARIGANCIIGKGVYIDFDVQIGNNVKIQNYASIYHGSTIEDGAFIGPYACLTNDKYPRAITPDGNLKRDDDWEVGKITVKYGAAVGTGAIILPDVIIGRFALVGAGTVVAKDVPDYALVVGTPGRFVGYVCQQGHHLQENQDDQVKTWYCNTCKETYQLSGANNDTNIKTLYRSRGD